MPSKPVSGGAAPDPDPENDGEEEQQQQQQEKPADKEDRATRLKRIELRRSQSAEEFKAKQSSSDGVFVRPRVVRRESFGDAARIDLIEFEGVAACRGAPFLCAIPGAGIGSMTSLLTVGFFAKQLKLPTVACLRVRGGDPEGVLKENEPGLSLRIMGNSQMVVRAWVGGWVGRWVSE